MQMTKGNVGSLLVFDPSKISDDGKASEDAVLGIITERGMHGMNAEQLPCLASCCTGCAEQAQHIFLHNNLRPVASV